jgi:hypothetical protein
MNFRFETNLMLGARLRQPADVIAELGDVLLRTPALNRQMASRIRGRRQTRVESLSAWFARGRCQSRKADPQIRNQQRDRTIVEEREREAQPETLDKCVDGRDDCGD